MDTVTVEAADPSRIGGDVREAEADTSGSGASRPSAARRLAARLARRTTRDPVVLVAAALVLLPTIAAIVSALRNPWVPSDDWALLELQVRAVGTADTPLVGAWSRFGWDHPGPWPLYLLAAFYRLVPGEHGLLFAAAAVNLLAVGGCVAVALRRSRAQALVVLAGLAVLQRGMGIEALGDPWNPLLPILPFALYCLVCAELAVDRRPWMLPVAAGYASFAVQAHVGFAQPVVLVGLAAAGSAWWAPGRRARADAGADDRPAGGAGAGLRWRAALPTAIVLLVAWAPVLLDQVAGDGNVGMIVRWALGDEVGPDLGSLNEGRLPADRVAGAASWLLDPFGPWLGNDDHPVAFGFELLGDRPPALGLWVPLVLAGSVLLATRAADAVERRRIIGAVVVAAAGVVATVTDLATAQGAPVLWPFRWVSVVVMLVWISGGWAVTAALSDALRRRHGWAPTAVARRAAVAGMLALVVVPVVATVWRGSLGHRPVENASDELLRLAPAIVEHARDEEVVVANSTVMLGAVDLGLPVVLARAGIPWVERDDPRAGGHAQLGILRAADLEGMHGVAVARGDAEILARSRPRGGGDPDAELLLLRIDSGPPDPGPDR